MPLLVMETRYAKSPNNRNGEDRISDLPRAIVHHIFSFLPSLEHVAKTCVLSKRWKHLWYSYPCLDFSTAFESIYRREREISGPDPAFQKLCDRIDGVFKSFDKHSDISVLKFYGLPPLDAATDSFMSLRSLNLSDADFRNQSSVLNLFADSLFPRLEKLQLESCKGLKHLRIRMSGLKYLCLETFKILELDISAQKLERLTVMDCFVDNAASNRVAIDAPLLESISWKNYVTGEFVIERCDLLKEATLQFCLGHVGFSDSQLCSFSSFLDGICQCQSLTLDVSVFEILWRCNNLAGVEQRVFNRLTSLEVKLSDANCVKWNEDLSDMIGNMEDDIDWESRARSLNSFLRRLKVVRIFGFKACSNDW